MHEPERVPQLSLCRIALLPQPAHILALVPTFPPAYSLSELLVLALEFLKPSLHPRLALLERAYTLPKPPLCVARPLHGVHEPVLKVYVVSCGLCQLLGHDGSCQTSV